MKKITIEITDAQYKAMGCDAMDVEEYFQNYATTRSQKALDKIADRELKRRFNEGLEIPRDKESIVMSEDVVLMKDMSEEVPPTD